MITINKNILFVCTGNTCRSPFAEFLFRKMLDEKYGVKADDVNVSSAGTYAFSGVTPPPDAIEGAKHFDVDMSQHQSRNVHLKMMEAASMVFCMTEQQKAHLIAKFPWFEDRIHLLKKFGDKEGVKEALSDDTYDIPDPIGRGLDFYIEAYGQIREALEKIIKIWEREKQFRMKMTDSFRIATGSDHAGFRLKSDIIEYLSELGHEVKDFGTSDDKTSVDYSDFARPAAEAVAGGDYDYGILICGSGVGVSITANRIKGIRAVLARDALTAKLSREHNKSNILCFGERFTTAMVARDIVKTWLSTGFEGGRHEPRIKKIDE